MYIEHCNSYCMKSPTFSLHGSFSSYDDVIVYLFLFTQYLLVHIMLQVQYQDHLQIVRKRDKKYGHQRKSDNVISQKSLIKFFNKSTSLQTLSLYGLQLSDMVSPP